MPWQFGPMARHAAKEASSMEYRLGGRLTILRRVSNFETYRKVGAFYIGVITGFIDS
jgi:hypothetical protein